MGLSGLWLSNNNYLLRNNRIQRFRTIRFSILGLSIFVIFAHELVLNNTPSLFCIFPRPPVKVLFFCCSSFSFSFLLLPPRSSSLLSSLLAPPRSSSPQDVGRSKMTGDRDLHPRSWSQNDPPTSASKLKLYFFLAPANQFYPVNDTWPSENQFYPVNDTWPSANHFYLVNDTWPSANQFYPVNDTWPSANQFSPVSDTYTSLVSVYHCS